MSQSSRRSFLQTAAAAGLAGCGLSRLAGIARAAADFRLSIGIQSYSLRAFPTDQAIDYAKELGFEHVEFYSGQFSPNSSPQEIEAMKKKLADKGLKTLGHGVNRFTKDHEQNRKLFVFAKAAGLRNLTADPDPDAFDSLEELVKEFDIRIAIHNHGPRHRYNKGLDVLNACKGRDQRIGACADLGHFIRSGEEPVGVCRLLGDRLYGIHLKDFAEMQDRTKGVILGRGHLNVEGVFAALKQINFPADGCLSLEYEENEKNPIDDIRQCLAIAKDAAHKVTGQT